MELLFNEPQVPKRYQTIKFRDGNTQISKLEPRKVAALLDFNLFFKSLTPIMKLKLMQNSVEQAPMTTIDIPWKKLCALDIFKSISESFS